MLAHWMGYLRSRGATVEPPQPENGPTGGANWLRGYKPRFDYSQPKKRRGKRDELLFLTV